MSNKTELTKKHIKQAYIELLDFHQPKEINVSEICKKCKINRSTFYEYFSYIDLLVNEVLNDQLNDIFQLNEGIYNTFYSSHYTDLENIKTFLVNFSSNKVILNLLRSDQSQHFKSLIVDLTVLYEIEKYGTTDDEMKMHILYRNAGVYSLTFLWVEKKMKVSLDEVANAIKEMMINQYEK